MMENFRGETPIFVRFYALDYFCKFCLINGHFMDFLNNGDCIDQSLWMNLWSLSDLGFLKELIDFGGNCDFGVVLCFRMFLMF